MTPTVPESTLVPKKPADILRQLNHVDLAQIIHLGTSLGRFRSLSVSPAGAHC